MTIKIKCPVCNAGNQLTPNNKTCRRCKEDLSLLYQIKGYSLAYRLYFAQLLLQNKQEHLQQCKNLMDRARWLEKG